MSGLVPYSLLLPAQILLIGLLTKICIDVSAGNGFFASSRPKLARFLGRFGIVYLVANIARGVVFGVCIPVVFHFVLAGFVLAYTRYQGRILNA